MFFNQVPIAWEKIASIYPIRFTGAWNYHVLLQLTATFQKRFCKIKNFYTNPGLKYALSILVWCGDSCILVENAPNNREFWSGEKIDREKFSIRERKTFLQIVMQSCLWRENQTYIFKKMFFKEIINLNLRVLRVHHWNRTVDTGISSKFMSMYLYCWEEKT